jgi:hypothetical protein
MFDRDNIIDEQDFARTGAKRFAPTPAPKAAANGIGAAWCGAVERKAAQLT